MLLCPALTLLLAVNSEKQQGDLRKILDPTTIQDCWQDLTYENLLPMHHLIAGYLAFQIVLYRFCPGSLHTGQHTPAGKLLEYKTNGLSAFIATYACFWLGQYYGLFDISFVATNFTTLVAALNIWGLSLTIAIYLKAHIYPTHLTDRVFTGPYSSPVRYLSKLTCIGNWLYDIFMGVELNPHVDVIGDLKLFVVGRTGMMIWPLVYVTVAFVKFDKNSQTK